jgi:hypothetical protein
MKVILNKYRNEWGRKMRSAYEAHIYGRRDEMQSMQARPDLRCGTVVTTPGENLLLEMLEL